ncbi:MAG: DNA replication and repair protein RecF [bacterium]|nr:DNA replication and repair protein RecF [bacterium]
MIISSVSLSNIRNFSKAHFEFSSHLTLIVGENARGKTNLLESVHMAVYGTGFRESRELELIMWDKPQGLVESIFYDNDAESLYQVELSQKENNRVEKRYFINKTHKSSNHYRANQTHAVLFAPQSLDIITRSPSRRRSYLDHVLSSIDLPYRTHLRNYENALRKRNKILEQHSNIQALKQELEFWNDYIVERASYITKKREDYIAFLNKHQAVDGRSFTIIYHKNECTHDLLERCFNKEQIIRKTFIGPQKDDFEVWQELPLKKNIHLYGSRSEQRIAIFWLALNEIKYVEQELNKKPILLLDDIFSELDEHNKKLVMHMISQCQTIITTTEPKLAQLAQMPEVVIEL